jgi:predicted aspartyl protease
MITEQNSAAPIKIKLINAIDEALITRELLSPKSLRCCEVEAILDPGIVYLVLPKQIAKQLGLRTAKTQSDLPTTEALRLEWKGHLITEDAMIAGDQVRLGRVVLEKLNLLTERVKPDASQPNSFKPDLAEPDFWAAG